MRLALSAYDPTGDMRARAERAVDAITREYNAVADPGVPIDADLLARTRATRERWWKKKGRFTEKARRDRRKEAHGKSAR